VAQVRDPERRAKLPGRGDFTKRRRLPRRPRLAASLVSPPEKSSDGRRPSQRPMARATLAAARLRSRNVRKVSEEFLWGEKGWPAGRTGAPLSRFEFCHVSRPSAPALVLRWAGREVDARGTSAGRSGDAKGPPDGPASRSILTLTRLEGDPSLPTRQATPVPTAPPLRLRTGSAAFGAPPTWTKDLPAALPWGPGRAHTPARWAL
jgi:hypothetical protein